jgi:hypothetical protein
VFNISEFKSRINRFGGPARTSLFVVTFSPRGIPREFITTENLRFFCQTITMPGVNLELMPYRQSGIGYPEFMPMNVAPDSLNGVFMLDSSHVIMSFFHNWINSVVNVNGDVGPNSRGVEQKEINYKSDYTTTMEIDFFTTHDQNRFYRCIYDGVFPTQVGSLTLNWSDNDSIATLPVNFSYSKMRYSGFQSTSFENSRLYLSLNTSIAQDNRINQIIRGFDQNLIDENAPTLT